MAVAKAEARPKVTRRSAQALHECPGGSHEPVQRAIGLILGELGLAARAICVAPVGCALLLFETLDIDCITVPPGRGPAVAAGIKQVHPQSIVFSFQGGWDAASTGTGEILHAARRGDAITVVYANLSAAGEAALPMSELVASIDGSSHVERVVLQGERELPALHGALTRAFTVQRDFRGFGFVEVSSPATPGNAERRSACLKERAAR